MLKTRNAFYGIVIITQGNKINYFPVAKAILTVFLFWDADYKFLLIFVLEGKKFFRAMYSYALYILTTHLKIIEIITIVTLKQGYKHDVIN